MKLPHGGYTPKVVGRPVADVEELPLPRALRVPLARAGLVYEPAVGPGDRVSFGDALAVARDDGAVLEIPAPAGGTVRVDAADEHSIVLEDLDETTERSRFSRHVPARTSAEEIRRALTESGAWPLFWSSRTGGAPAADGSEVPQGIVVNFVVAEPYRARGRVLLTRCWHRIISGIRFLPRILADYGRVEVILTHVHDPVAQDLYRELSGHAWVRLHAVPVTYPIENSRLLIDSVRRETGSYSPDAVLWTMDPQAIEAVGACLENGVPAYRRVVAVGGPGAERPRHVEARIGTPIRSFLPELDSDRTLVLRGGILLGDAVDADSAVVEADDDAFFLLPRSRIREMLSFVRPGFDRISYTPAFVSALAVRRDPHRGAVDKGLTNSLRGERRPCISCGACERICPAGLMPQVLHRYLHREGFEQAEAAGLERCVDCNLCTYVCPSKIELQQQFTEARARLQAERAEMAMEREAAE
jgi:Na(+)-translocating NADH:ubiquinone oxidoreductase A subunit